MNDINHGDMTTDAQKTRPGNLAYQNDRFRRGFDVKSLKSIEEAEFAIFEIMEQIESIDQQLDEAKLFPEEYEDEDSRDWLIRANAARRGKSRIRQHLQMHLAKLRKAERKEQHEAHQKSSELILISKLAAAIRFVNDRLGHDGKSELLAEFDRAEIVALKPNVVSDRVREEDLSG